jgi:hypothetical protein
MLITVGSGSSVRYLAKVDALKLSRSFDEKSYQEKTDGYMEQDMLTFM